MSLEHRPDTPTNPSPPPEKENPTKPLIADYYPAYQVEGGGYSPETPHDSSPSIRPITRAALNLNSTLNKDAG